MSKIRKPAVAGMFYPAQPERLKNEVDLLLSVAKPAEIPGTITGLVVPHAGYIYSGRTAAYAFNTLKGENVETAVIISPSHREYFAGTSVFDGDAYETPLGSIPVNKNMVEKITAGSETIFKGSEGHGEEHAVEVQLPFLQRILEDFSIVPIVMGDQGKFYVDQLAEKIASAADEKTIIIASSDMSHYYSKSIADELDSVVERRIENFDYEGLLNDLTDRRCEACGGGPIVAAMKAAALMNKNKSLVLNRSDSGDTSGDNNEVVGYLSAVIYGD